MKSSRTGRVSKGDAVRLENHSQTETTALLQRTDRTFAAKHLARILSTMQARRAGGVGTISSRSRIAHRASALGC